MKFSKIFAFKLHLIFQNNLIARIVLKLFIYIIIYLFMEAFKFNNPNNQCMLL
jgi:hypothetical protein